MVIEQEDAKESDDSRRGGSEEPYITQAGSSEFQPVVFLSSNKSEAQDSTAVDNSTDQRSSNSSPCDLTKISGEEKEVDRTASPWRSKEMPLLRRHSSVSEYDDPRVEEQAHFSGASRRINSSSSPPRLQRVPISVDTAIETRSSRVVTSGSLGEPARNHLETSGNSYSPNFPSHPPRLVRHSASFPERNASPALLQHDTLTLGSDANRRQSSPFFDLASSKPVSVQSFQERPFARTIPIADSLIPARRSPLFTSSGARYKSTYVFSNRQTYLQPENEPRPLPVSTLIMLNENGLNATGNRLQVNSMHLQTGVGFGRLDERQLSRSMQGQCARPSSSYIHRGANAGVISDNRNLNSSPVTFKRIPSPRSELFSGMSSGPVNTSCMSHVNVPNSGSMSFGSKPMALPPTIRQNENSLEGLPPAWSHLESTYSIPSAALRHSPPKPYSFSANLSQSSRHSGTYSVSHSNTGTPERYSVGPAGSGDCQYVSVIQRASASKGEPLNNTQRDLWTGEQENVRTFQLPKAFQGGDLRPDLVSNPFLNKVAFPGTSRKEQLSKPDLIETQPYLNKYSTENSNHETSSPLVYRSIPEKPPPSDSPSLKAKKDKVPVSTVSVNTASKASSSPKSVKKTVGSKQKEAICPLIDKANDSPVFYPSEEEFRDPVAYIKMIRRVGEKFGVCVISPPESWKVCSLCCFLFSATVTQPDVSTLSLPGVIIL